MLNQVVFVGRIVKVNKVLSSDNVYKYSNVVVAVNRNFKNEDGEYDTDFISCRLYNSIATSVHEYCKKGDLIGVKGRLQTENNRLYVIGERVSFLSSNFEKGEA